MIWIIIGGFVTIVLGDFLYVYIKKYLYYTKTLSPIEKGLIVKKDRFLFFTSDKARKVFIHKQLSSYIQTLSNDVPTQSLNCFTDFVIRLFIKRAFENLDKLCGSKKWDTKKCTIIKESLNYTAVCYKAWFEMEGYDLSKTLSETNLTDYSNSLARFLQIRFKTISNTRLR